MNKREALILGLVVYSAAFFVVTWQFCGAVHKSGSLSEVVTVAINVSQLILFFAALVISGIMCVVLIKMSARGKFPLLLIPMIVVFIILMVMFLPILVAWSTNMATPNSSIGRLLTNYPPHTLEAVGWFALLLLLLVAAIWLITGWKPSWPRRSSMTASSSTSMDRSHDERTMH